MNPEVRKEFVKFLTCDGFNISQTMNDPAPRGRVLNPNFVLKMESVPFPERDKDAKLQG